VCDKPDLEHPPPNDEPLLGVFVSSGVDLRMNAFTITFDRGDPSVDQSILLASI